MDFLKENYLCHIMIYPMIPDINNLAWDLHGLTQNQKLEVRISIGYL